MLDAPMAVENMPAGQSIHGEDRDNSGFRQEYMIFRHEDEESRDVWHPARYPPQAERRYQLSRRPQSLLDVSP